LYNYIIFITKYWGTKDIVSLLVQTWGPRPFWNSCPHTFKNKRVASLWILWEPCSKRQEGQCNPYCCT